MPDLTDRLIIELLARQERFEREMKRAADTTERQLGKIEKRAKQFSTKIEGELSSSLKGLAATIATYFTGRELAGLLDSYTRLQNNLRVAGVEGEHMRAVQDRLFQSAQRYGVELEGLSSLFSTLTQASKELGASQSQIFQLTDAVSASLKIQGMSAQQAAGALLQLGQALRGGKIQAEEYNSLLDGLYPLLEAAANGSDRFSGSVSKLTRAVKDGEVTSREFFAAILAGSEKLEQKAAKANLTIEQSLTALSNAITVYMGEADKANGVTVAFSAAIMKLADNLDVVIPAVGVLATGLGVGLVTNMLRARVAAGLLGASLLNAFGGPVGIAITGIIVALGYAVAKQKEGIAATGEYARATEDLKRSQEAAAKIINQLATATGRARNEALAAARAQREHAQRQLEAAKATLAHAKAQQELANSAKRAANAPNLLNAFAAHDNDPRAISDIATKNAAQADANAKAAQQRVEQLQKMIDSLSAAINAGPPSSTSGLDGVDDKKKKGKSAAQIAFEYETELRRNRMEELRARQELTADVQERAELERQILEEERKQRLAEIENNEDYSAARKAALRRQVEKLYGAGGGNGEIDVKAGLYQRQTARDLAAEENRVLAEQLQRERQVLEAEAELLDTREERLAAELRILDILEREEQARLEAEIAARQIADADGARAALARAQAARRADTARGYESPLERYRRRLDETSIGDQVEALIVDELDRVRDTIRNTVTKRLGIKDPLLAGVIDLFIQHALIRPMAEALAANAGKGAGGGGLVGSIVSGLGAIFGRASGGYVAPGQMVRVNESAAPGRVEAFRPTGSGEIIPLGRVQAAQKAAGITVMQSVNVDARGAVMNDEFASLILARSEQQAIVAAQVAMSQAQHNTIRMLGRPRLPGSLG